MKLIQKTGILFVLVSSVSVASRADQETAERLEKEIAVFKLDGLIRTAIGVTHDDTPIPAFIPPDDLDPYSKKYRILLVGGLDGETKSIRSVLAAAEWFQDQNHLHEQFVISCVPCARPDAWEKEEIPQPLFPPKGNAYNQPANDTAHYLWRWIGMHAPDLVIDVRKGDSRKWSASAQSDHAFLSALISPEGFGKLSANSLADALAHQPPAETGIIPAFQHEIPDGTEAKSVSAEMLAALSINDLYTDLEVSLARTEIRRRLARSPVEIARQLAKVYGQKLDPIMYIPSLAVIGQIRLGELTDDPDRLRRAEKLAAPFQTGERESMPAKGNGSTLSGHLIFSELARRTGDDAWTDLAKKAADYGFDEDGKPKESMPFHSEMSDAVFMGCAILAEVGALTDEKKYFDQCLRHLKFMENLCLRDDGLYRHSPLDEAAWGRGNGFPALGMALSLSALPEDSDAFAFFLKSYRAHLEALKKHQDPTGAWHQVIDHEESYREFTSTCMITFAIVRGIRRGWLDEKEWAPVVEKSWRAIKSRIGPKGRLVDVCTGTGKQKSLRDYFDRTAILGTDDRGGAMALMVSTEIAFWENGE